MPGNSLLLACLAIAVCGTAIVTAQDDETVVRDTPGDFDGDGKADQGHWKSDGTWELDLAANGFGETDVKLTGCGDRSMAAETDDADGDGKSDLRLRVSATDALVDLAANGYGRWDQHEITTPQSGKQIRKLLNEKMVNVLEHADSVVPYRLTLPTFDVVEAESPSDSDAPAPESDATTDTVEEPAQNDPEKTGDSDAEPRADDVTIDGIVAASTGQPLNVAERSLLRSLLFSDSSYVFGVTKRRPFVPSYAFRMTQKKDSVDILVDTDGAMLMLLHGDHRVTLNCDRAMSRLQLLLARIQPETPAKDDSADKEPTSCVE